MPTFTTGIPYCTGGPNHSVDKDLKRLTDWKGRNKLYIDDMIFLCKSI